MMSIIIIIISNENSLIQKRLLYVNMTQMSHFVMNNAFIHVPTLSLYIMKRIWRH